MFILTGLYCAERILVYSEDSARWKWTWEREGGREGVIEEEENGGVETEGEGKRSRGYSGTSTEEEGDRGH